MSTQKEPIAIVGIGCRFPGGAANPRLFWRNLCQGKDAIVDVPAERWDVRKFYDPNPDKPGKSYVKQGGFLRERIDEFDPLFFGISPREAESMDPQQRLLLEVTWEAFEDAGIVAEELSGSKTGVFIGGFCLDSLILRVGPLNRELADTHTAASSTMTILSNRISHIFDLTGPSVSMDTACSSSLVTTHFACQSLWNGDADMAIAGGVNIMLRPEFPIAMSKGHFLSDHGRCMAFDQRASGYTRGEGAGVVILKPLSAALAHHDDIYALIKMTGVNQDGHTPGISMPNPEAQAQLIRSVYRKAGINPGEVGYIEAHGTGTQAGDPKEAQALDSVLSEGRATGQKCLIGSVKTNIGHLEAGAGVAGLIKAALCVHEGKIPPSLHFETPNPNIPFDAMCIEVATQLSDWPGGYRIRYAGVNSFGYGGTNAHVLLQEPPPNLIEPNTNICDWRRPYLLPLSARNETALAALAGKYAFHLGNLKERKTLADFLHTITCRRSHLRHRLALVTETLDELREKLQHYSNGNPVEGLFTAECEPAQRPSMAFIYSGMGPQWWAMGRELMDKEPLFLATIKECDSYFIKQTGWSILEALRADENQSRMTRTDVAQPGNFVIQIALTALLKDWGIEPDAVIGHSVGEVSAAYISGALSLEDAIKVSFHRSRLQATTAGNGSMLAAALSEPEALKLIEHFDKVSIAAINSPASVTLSGDKLQLQDIAATLQQRNIFNRFLQVEVAYHSSQMEPIKNEILASLATLKPRPTHVPLYSTVTGELVNGTDINSDYWWHNVRKPVRFAKGIQSLLQANFRNFLEISPHPVLSHSVQEITKQTTSRVTVIPTLNRKQPEQKRMLECLGQLYTAGCALDWKKVTPEGGGVAKIPTYPWQKERYWSESLESMQDRLGLPGHVFLNQRLSSPLPTWTVEINDQYFPYLKDHRVLGEIVYPGAAYVEAGLALHKHLTDHLPAVIADINLHNILLIEPEKIQLLASVYDDDTKQFQIFSKIKDDKTEWRLHASGRLVTDVAVHVNKPVDIATLVGTFDEEYSCAEMYRMLSNRKLDYGPSFQNARQLWTSEREFLVHIFTKEQPSHTDSGYLLHPVILDTALHSLLSLVKGDTPFVPVSIERVVLYRTGVDPCYCHGILTSQTASTLTADFFFYDESGEPAGEIKKCFSRILDYTAESKASEHENNFYESTWVTVNNPDFDKDISQCLVFNDGSEIFESITTGLESKKIPCYTVTQGPGYKKLSTVNFEINDQDEADYNTLIAAVDFENISHVIYLWPLTSVDDVNAEAITGISMKLLFLVRALSNVRKDIKLVIVTRCAQVVTRQETTVRLCNSPLWGLGPLIGNEYPHITCRLIDIDRDDEFKLNPFLLFYDVSDLAVRSGNILIKRIIKSSPVDYEIAAGKIKLSTDEPLEMRQLKPGQVDTLDYFQVDRERPGKHEVEIKVNCTALNFKDVLKVYNSIPDEVTNHTYFGKSVGIEITGKVIRTGAGVTRFQPGDEVIAAAKGSFRTYATVPDSFVWAKPPMLRAEQSLFYVAFSTAYYALVDIARLRAGESILIHSAAGALGLASIQIARWLGAEIYVTASTEEKRTYLKSLGITHVMDSRSLAFVDKIRSITDGKGIDVVINALSGELLWQSFNLLAPYGRFIEVGKTDIIENHGLPMAAFNQNLSFSSIDFDRMHLDRPEEVDRLVNSVMRGFEAGYLKPLPVTVFKASDVADAFRFMAQSKHIGKVVVKFEGEMAETILTEDHNQTYKPDGTYLIVGGTSGFGLEVAKWLGSKAIGRLILVSRKGPASLECQQAIKILQEKGIAVSALAVDVTDYKSVATLINHIQQDGPPLRGIFNSAMVLDDAFIKDITTERFYKVLAPKVTGTLHLYSCTKDLELDFFVGFSSISSLIGNAGQANYVAANSFLDEFAHAARLKGFPAITINWGVLAESGVVSRNKDLNKILAQEGMHGLTNREALIAMDTILAGRNPQTGVFKTDWSQWGKMNPHAAKSTRFSLLVQSYTGTEGINITVKALETEDIIKNKTTSEQIDYIADNLRSGMSKILKMAPEKIKLDHNLSKLGIDSLMLVELSLAIREEFGIDISAMELFKQATLRQLTEEIIRRLFALKETEKIN